VPTFLQDRPVDVAPARPRRRLPKGLVAAGVVRVTVDFEEPSGTTG
jgi:hypothetical protein